MVFLCGKVIVNKTELSCWTDYPILELGDKSGEIAPIRQCKLICWDGDIYSDIDNEEIAE